MQIKQVTESFTLARIVPYFQPIMDIQHNSVWRYECLARLVNENEQTFIPSEFLYLVERDNQVELLAETVFQQSAQYFRNINLAWNINISENDLHNPKLLGFFATILEQYPRPQRVALELTARAAIQQLDILPSFIEQCHKLGLSMFIDRCDLPLEQSKALLQLAIKGIKLAGSLVNKLATEETSQDYVQQLATLAKQRRVVLVAEHIEQLATLEAVQSLGVRYGQGYYFSRPAAQTQPN